MVPIRAKNNSDDKEYSPCPTKTINHVGLVTCRTVAEVMYHFRSGMYAEVSYTREKIHVHKLGLEIKYYEQTKTAALPQLFHRLKHHIYSAFPYVQHLIIECEILRVVVDKYGSPVKLDYHSKAPSSVENLADLCIFVTDCMYYDMDLSKRSYMERVEFLRRNIIEIPTWVELPRSYAISNLDDLRLMIERVLKSKYATGLLMKDSNGVYDAQTVRHLRLSKNSFLRMRDNSVLHLLVLGASNVKHHETSHYRVEYLLGCYDEENDKFLTVTLIERKGAYNFDKMRKTYRNLAKLPDWLSCKVDTIPEYVAKDRKSLTVWRVSGLALLKDDRFTAQSISLLCPEFQDTEKELNLSRVTKLKELEATYTHMYEKLVAFIKKRAETIKTVDAKEIEEIDPTVRQEQEGEPPSKDLSKVVVLRPQYFTFVRLYLLPEVIGKHSRWLAVFLECGGTIIPEGNIDRATHVLHLHNDAEQDENFSRMKHCIHIIIEWIRDSVLSMCVKDIRPYTVRLLPKGHQG